MSGAIRTHEESWLGALGKDFLGSETPNWYKNGLIFLLIINVVSFKTSGAFVTGWLILFEFILTLALTRTCYPLWSGGLLLLQAMALELVSIPTLQTEIEHNMPILFLILFVVTAVTLLKEFLTHIFLRALLALPGEILVGFFYLLSAAVFSGILDALTVTAVVIAVLLSAYEIYHVYESKNPVNHDLTNDVEIDHHRKELLENLRAYLRKIAMLAAIGTMLGGITTLVGEPQNLLIGKIMNWDFNEFFFRMLPVDIPVIISGIITYYLLEKNKWLKTFGYNVKLNPEVKSIIYKEVSTKTQKRSQRERNRLTIQGLCVILLVIMLVLHFSEVYIAGLILLIIVSSLNGVSEHKIGEAITEGGSFIFILVILFGIVGMIHDQHLFAPVSKFILSFEGPQRLLAFYLATGGLSAISDNVFVASLFITDAKDLFTNGLITKEEFENIAVAINMGTNIPSISTPNGQAAFLFLLMSRLAPLIRLGYGKMMWMAFPFAVVCSTVGAVAMYYY